MRMPRNAPAEIALLLGGHIVGAMAVILIKASTLHPLLLAGGRLLLASLVLLPVYLREVRKRGRLTFRDLLPSVLPGLFLAAHFSTWAVGARMTLGANASLIVNMTPVVMPFFVFAFTREVIRRLEVVGTVVAIAGVVILGLQSVSFGTDTLPGDAVCFVSMLFFAAYLALARRNRRGGSIWLYVTPVYFVGGVVTLVTAAFAVPADAYVFSLRNTLTLLGLVAGPTLIAHTVLNHAMGVLPSQLVSISQISQVIWASIAAFLVFGEVPSPLFYAAAAAIAAGITIVVMGHGRAARAARRSQQEL
jgi:drug/metabolite transporter (DMT)-like permease